MKKINPHHFNIQANSSSINLSFASQKNIQFTEEQSMSQNIRKMRLLSILIGSLYNKKTSNAFRSIKFKPLRTIYLKKRLVQVFLGLIRRTQYNKKYEGFLKLKKNFIKIRNEEVKQLNNVLSKAKISAIKILSILLKTKSKSNIETGFKKISLYARQRYSEKCAKYRKGFRLWIKAQNSVVQKCFTKLRSSRYLIQRRLKIQGIAKVLRQYRLRSYKMGIEKLRRNMYRQRQSTIRSQILQIESKLQSNEDQQLKTLKHKQQQLKKSLVQVQKQKQQISQAYQIQVKQAESKNVQIQSRIKSLKQQNMKLIQSIKEINQKLKQEFTLDEVFQMFYNNFLFYISRNRNSQLIKSEMLEALTKPLISIDIPLNQLKQQNKTYKDLLSEYVLIYGQKSLQGKQLQIPYEYLVKQNETMYKMLVTLLPRLQYNKKNVSQLRDTLQSVQTIVKQFRM